MRRQQVVVTGAVSVLVLMMVGVAVADRVVCPCTADSWLNHDYGGRTTGLDNYGGDAQLQVSSRVRFVLMDFDVSAARGMTVEKATLRVHLEGPEDLKGVAPLHTVGLSTISGIGSWGEGKGTGGRALPGESSFFYAKTGQQEWSYPGSDISDVTFGVGGSLYSYERSTVDENGWLEVNVPPAMVHALMTGDQYGLMFCDEKGQTWLSYVLAGRESGKTPLLVIEGERVDQTPPGRVEELRGLGGIVESKPADIEALNRTSLRPGSVVLAFGKAGDDNGDGVATRYEVRYATWEVTAANFEMTTAVPRWCLNPLAPKPSWSATSNSLADTVSGVVEGLVPDQVYYFAARAMDEAGNAGPVSSLGKYRAYSRNFPALPREAAGGERKVGAAAGPAGGKGVAIWAVGDMAKINPKTGELLESDGYSKHRLVNRVWDASSRTVRLVGSRNEFVAFQLAIESEALSGQASVTVAKKLFADVELPKVFAESGAVELHRIWHVPDDAPGELAAEMVPWYPDGLVPLDGPVSLPPVDNTVPGQKVQPFWVDVYIPHDAEPGVHTGMITVACGSGGDALVEDVKLEVVVLPITLPDKLNFVVDLNVYGGINSGYRGIGRGTPEHTRLVHKHHRLTHMHRTNLNVLGYGQSGNIQPDHEVPLSGEGAATVVTDWSKWDAHFGPMLDGSAFADLPRASVPLVDMYLPFHENWPSDIHTGYKHEYPTPQTMDEYDAMVKRHAMEAAPIEQAFTKEYVDRFVAVMRQFAEHVVAKGYDQTDFQVYLNNKYYWKRPQNGRLGTGSAWWLLDEPNHRDDIRALSFYGELMRRGLEGQPDARIVYRTDISRIYWIRDLLTNQLDLNCISRKFYEKNRYLMDNRDKYGRTVWNYGSSNHPRQSNVNMRAWCWRTWVNGGDGLLPWNSIRNEGAWDRATTLTLFYPGTKFGKNEPYASMRLKAFRRGQQDVEYLVLLAAKEGWDRDAVSVAAGGAVNLRAEVIERGFEDAGTISFSGIEDDKLDEVRLRVAAALLAD